MDQRTVSQIGSFNQIQLAAVHKYISPSFCPLLRREDCDNWKMEDDSKSNGDCSLLLPEYGEL